MRTLSVIALRMIVTCIIITVHSKISKFLSYSIEIFCWSHSTLQPTSLPAQVLPYSTTVCSLSPPAFERARAVGTVLYRKYRYYNPDMWNISYVGGYQLYCWNRFIIGLEKIKKRLILCVHVRVMLFYKHGLEGCVHFKKEKEKTKRLTRI